MKLEFRGICTDAYIHPEKGTQSLSFVDMDNGGQIKISMGANQVEVHGGMIVNAVLTVKGRQDKAGGSYLVFEGGTFKAG